MGTRIRAAVVGAGHFGRFHARHYANLPDVDLVAVVDRDGERARAVAAEFGAAALASHAGLGAIADVASVAVPTSAHFDVARDLVEEGLHILVEKPVTATLGEAEALCRLAAARRVRLSVGHIERFSSAYRALKEVAVRPRFLECRRMNRPVGRATDVDVVLDLMIHDIDLSMDLAGAPVVRVEAVGSAVINRTTDVCQARLTFANGVVADLAASRIADAPERVVRAYCADGAYVADLAACTLTRVAVGTDGSGAIVKREIAREDSLAAEIAAFLVSVEGGTRPPVDGEAGRAVLAVAEQVAAAAWRHQHTLHLAASA